MTPNPTLDQRTLKIQKERPASWRVAQHKRGGHRLDTQAQVCKFAWRQRKVPRARFDPDSCRRALWSGAFRLLGPMHASTSLRDDGVRSDLGSGHTQCPPPVLSYHSTEDGSLRRRRKLGETELSRVCNYPDNYPDLNNLPFPLHETSATGQRTSPNLQSGPSPARRAETERKLGAWAARGSASLRGGSRGVFGDLLPGPAWPWLHLPDGRARLS